MLGVWRFVKLPHAVFERGNLPFKFALPPMPSLPLLFEVRFGVFQLSLYVYHGSGRGE